MSTVSEMLEALASDLASGLDSEVMEMFSPETSLAPLPTLVSVLKLDFE